MKRQGEAAVPEIIMTGEKLPHLHWRACGFAGAVIVPVGYVGLWILRSLVPSDSLAYTLVNGMVRGIVVPVTAFIDDAGFGTGAHGGGVAAVIAFFFLAALYLPAIGFAIGSLTPFFLNRLLSKIGKR